MQVTFFLLDAIKRRAAPSQVAVGACAEAAPSSLHEIHFVLFNPQLYDAFISAVLAY